MVGVPVEEYTPQSKKLHNHKITVMSKWDRTANWMSVTQIKNLRHSLVS